MRALSSMLDRCALQWHHVSAMASQIAGNPLIIEQLLQANINEIVKAPHNWSFDLGHDDVIKWKHFPRYWPFVRGIHRSPVNSPQKGQWRGALMFSLICTRINGWVNNREAGDLRRHRAHYDVTVMYREGDGQAPPMPKRTVALIARFMGPTWGPSRTDRTQVGPTLAPWTLLSGMRYGCYNWCIPRYSMDSSFG